MTSKISTPDESPFAGSARLGAPLPDCPVRRPNGRDSYLLEQLNGDFMLLAIKGDKPVEPPAGVKLATVGIDVIDTDGVLAQRLDATPGAVYLLRPDQHLAGRWRTFDRAKVEAARARALAG